MNAKKALELLLQGKKIRQVGWTKLLYITLDEYGKIIKEQNNVYCSIYY